MTPKIKCVIVDDEPIGREIIENFVSQINYLELVASCEDAFEAIDILQSEQIDLMFSDIQMPKINGLNLMRSLPSPPLVVFITAHEKFAVQGFDADAIDYLLKPVTFDRFLKSANKARKQIELNNVHTSSIPQTQPGYIFIKADNKLNKIQFKDILYIEAVKDYIKIFRDEGYLLTYFTMKAIEEKLPIGQFIRIHHSYIIQLNAVKSLMGNTVELANGISIPVSKIHKDELFAALQIIKNQSP